MKGFIKHFCSSLLILFTAGMIACGGGGGGGGSGIPLTEQQLTEQDAAKIEITYADGNNINAVTDNISLPDSGDNGSDITWTSNNSGYLDANGAVTRPTFGTGNQTVTLTATLVNGSSTVTKDFIFTILEIPPTDEQAVAQAKSNLNITYQETDSESAVTSDVELAETGLNNTNINWFSDKPEIINADGTVHPPSYGSGNVVVTLIATITKGEASTTKNFQLTVIEIPNTDVQAVAYTLANLKIGYQGTDNESSVTLSVALPTAGSYNTSIEWSTNEPDYISTNGIVTQPTYLTGDQNVILTATVRLNDASDSKQFNLKVIKKAITDAEAVQQDCDALKIGFAGTDNESSVSRNLTLPLSGSNSTNISWTTSNSAYISSEGNVTQPAYSAGNQNVTLTATIRKNSESRTKEFALIVIPKVNIYITGSDGYWKNGIWTSLHPDNQLYCYTTSVFVFNNDVYVAGYYYNYSGDPDYACYWKNGTKTILASSTTNSCRATSIFVSGTDVYVAGRSDTGWCYWINGTQTLLPDAWSVESIYVSGGNVYTAGWATSYKACYWENATKNDISGGSTWSQSFSIYVSGSSVYTAGNFLMYPGAKFYTNSYCVNTTRYSLDDLGEGGYSIKVSAGNVYVAGISGQIDSNNNRLYSISYWKNGTKHALSTPSWEIGSKPSLFVFGNDVYVTGSDSNGACYWKNGVRNQLSSDSGGTTSIFITD